MERTQKKQLFAAGVPSAALVLCLACGSADERNPRKPIVKLPNDRVEVFVAGSVTGPPAAVEYPHPPMDMETRSHPVLWTSDSQALLDGNALGHWGSTANSVFVAGGDVFVAGVDNTPQQYGYSPFLAPALWKNGKKTLLGLSATNNDGGEARSVFVSGDDVHVGGYQFLEGVEARAEQVTWMEESKMATLWKNGEPTLLGTPAHFNSSVSSVFADGEDVYAAGGFWRWSELQKDGTRYFYEADHAAVWKNGEVVLGDVAGPNSHASSVFVSGGDVYVAGGEWEINVVYGNQRAVLWVNGEPRYLSDFSQGQSCVATSVFVSGGDVYVAGNEYVSDGSAEGRSRAILWKIGEKTVLADSFDPSVEYLWDYYVVPSSVYVLGGDVYVVGEEYTAFGKEAVIWVNGERQGLCQGDYRISTANSVFVKATK